MWADISTVMWKEVRGLLRQGDSRVRPVLGLLAVAVMIGILMPLQLAREWVDSAWSLMVAFIMPLLLVGVTVPESFAGERERHTLPTLLASRLPDRAILFGKLITAVCYGWAMTLVMLLVSLLVANAVNWQGQFEFYAPLVIVADVLFSLLVCGLVATLGVLISLHSATAQGASQVLVFALLLPIMVIQVAPMLLLTVVPNGQDVIRQALAVDFGLVALVLCGILLLADATLLLAAMARFQRSRLILE